MTFQRRLIEGETIYTNETVKFGKVIKEKRKQIGMNQTQFGELLDANQGTISMWELGITSPSFETAEYILKVLGFELLIRERQSE